MTMKTEKAEFYVEMTDTFGGEANYSWVSRFAVMANNPRHAISKVSRETGYSFRKEWDSGEMVRYKARGACVCAFVEYFDPDKHSETRTKVIE